MNNRYIVRIMICLVCLSVINGQSFLNKSRQTAITKAIEKVSPAVACINVIQIKQYTSGSPFNDPFFQFFFPYQLRQQQVKSQGSGVVISPDGYVLTNNHVVENALEIIVTIPGGEEYEGEIVGTDEVTDLALIKMKGNDFPYAALGNSDELIIGEWVIALGNPYGLFDINNQPTATAGIISAVNMDFGRQESGKIFQDMIQTDAAINPGNSGGPLVNSNGKVIGINTFIFTGSNYERGSVGIGFAIPINHAQEIAEELKTTGSIDRSFTTGLEVQPLDSRLAKYLGIPFNVGVIVLVVERNSPAKIAGIQTADIITKVNGQTVKSPSDIFGIIEDSDLRHGSQIEMEIFRDDRFRVVNLVLGD